MLKYFKNNVQKKIEKFIHEKYTIYSKNSTNPNLDDFSFMMFLDIITIFLYVVFFIFATISIYFFMTKEILPLIEV
tara:strand:- start:831 stop:1058 length:228 start_codon:yes stop_codon:yes gene_type:complete